MIQRSPSILLLALLAMCSLTLAGCQVANAWRDRMTRGDALATTDEEPYLESGDYVGTDAPGASGFRPGHSTNPDVFNEYYAPYDDEPSHGSGTFDPPAQPLPRESGRYDRLNPPLVPPSRSESLPSMPDQPLGQGVKQPTSPKTSDSFIKTLRTPRLFAPGGVRGMYDRLRGEDAGENVVPPPTGPIARLPFRESAAQACLYSEVEAEASYPVTLGPPEPVLDLASGQTDFQDIGIAGRHSPLPVLMQATPSSFKHPLLADPTGVRYPGFSDF